MTRLAALLFLVLALVLRQGAGALPELQSHRMFPFASGSWTSLTVNYPPAAAERVAADLLALVALQLVALAFLTRGPRWTAWTRRHPRAARLVLAATVAWPFVVVECGLRAYMSAHPLPHRPDALMEYAPTPGFRLDAGDTPSRNNSRGLRSPEIERGRAAGTLRILVLGDSATWGSLVGVEEPYPRQLERIGALAGVRLQVVNAAVGGFCSLQGLEHARRLVPYYQPDVVLFGYNNDCMAVSEVADRDRIPSHPVTRAVQHALYGSELYLLLRREVMNRFGPAPLTADRPAYTKGWPQRVSLPDHRENYRALIALARRHGARPGILILPTGHTPGYDEGDRVLAREEGIACVDFTPLWTRTGQSVADLTFDGIHPTPRGHRLLARLLWEGLQEPGTIPAATVATWPADFAFTPPAVDDRARWRFSEKGAERVP